jgi:arylsulfatase A-like enzyme
LADVNCKSLPYQLACAGERSVVWAVDRSGNFELLRHRDVVKSCVFCVIWAMAAAGAEAGQPNVVWIVADDLGYGELGCFGGRGVATPSLDALAKGGVRFTEAYVTAPFCAASRAALVTGRYQTRFGFEFNPIGAANAEPGIGLPASERTVADYLREAGYATGLVGKWHLGGTAPFHPQRRGFDAFFGFLHEGHYYVPPPWEGHVTWLRRKTLPDGSQGRWTSPDGRVVWSTHMGGFEPDYDADNPILRGSQPVDEPANLTDAFTREAEAFIARHKSQPFFLYLSYNAVHSPLMAQDEWLKKFEHIPDVQRRIFAAMLAQLDAGVGRVLARLRELNLAENTLVVFLSDNGGPTRELTSSNRPLRGEKGQLLEGGIRVPLILRWPARIPAGNTDSRLVSALDLLPTALTAAGAQPPAELDGMDLLPHLASDAENPIRASHYWRVGGRAAFREGDWKIYRPSAGAAWQLYNLREDIAEERDRAAAEAARASALEAAWKALDAQMVPPRWGGPGSRAKAK